MVCWATCHRFVAKHAAAPYQPERLWRPPRVPWEPHRPIQLERGLWAHPTDPLGWWKPPQGVPGACGGQRGGAPALAAEAPEHPDAHGPPYMGAFLIPNDHTERQGPRGTVPRPALPLESKAKGKEGPHGRRSVRVELPQLWALGRYWPGPWGLWRRSGGRRLNAATGGLMHLASSGRARSETHGTWRMCAQRGDETRKPAYRECQLAVARDRGTTAGRFALCFLGFESTCPSARRHPMELVSSPFNSNAPHVVFSCTACVFCAPSRSPSACLCFCWPLIHPEPPTATTPTPPRRGPAQREWWMGVCVRVRFVAV